MAHSTKTERRALTSEEFDLVRQTHHPQARELSDSDLAHILRLVRERRDRAQDGARRQRREMRGKAAPKGAEPARRDSGMRIKADVLAMAVRRLNSERERRRRKRAKFELIENAKRALAMRRETETAHRPHPGRTADQGMRAIPNKKPEDLDRPMEAGRVSQFVKDAQAKRDSR